MKIIFGKMTWKIFIGEFGTSSEVSPYLASILYAGDRFESMDKIKQWLAEGFTVIADRCTPVRTKFIRAEKISIPKKKRNFCHGWKNWNTKH